MNEAAARIVIEPSEWRGSIGAHMIEEVRQPRAPPNRPMASRPSTQTWRVFWTTFGNARMRSSVWVPGRRTAPERAP